MATEFSRRLFGVLAAKDGNLVISPLSIFAVLGMVSGGAKGNTLDEIVAALGFSKTPAEEVQTSIASVLKSFDPAQAQKIISIANKLCVAHKATLEQKFVSGVKELYSAEVESKDTFFDDEAASRKDINSWVEAQTQGMIKNLIAPGVLHQETLLVLINAIYFKADWTTSFDPAKTIEDADFNITESQKSKVALMTRRGTKEQYGENNVAKWVRLGYKSADQQFSAIFVLPQKSGDLTSVKDHFFGAKAEKLQFPTHETKLDVLAIPRFKLACKTELKELLQKLGINDAFARSADFSGISSTPLVISAVIHEARVEVDEKGTVAAAATAMVMACALVRVQAPHKRFEATEPFLFLIEHVPSKSVVFIAKINNPAE